MDRRALRAVGALGLAAVTLVTSAAAGPAFHPARGLASAGAAAGTPARGLPRMTREQMESRLERSPDARRGAGFLVVYGTLDPDWTPVLRERSLGIARRLFGSDSTRVRPDRDVHVGELARHAVVLVGGSIQNAWTRRLAYGLPVEFTPRGFRWFGGLYQRPGDVLHLVYPNPLDPARFLFLVAGNSRDAVARRDGGFLFGGDDWRIYRDGELMRSGRFAQLPGHPWAFDPVLDRDRETERERFAAALEVRVAGAVELRAPAKSPPPVELLHRAELLAGRLQGMGLASQRAPRLEVTLYRTLEEKGRLTLDTRPEHLDRAGAVHAALPAGRFDLDLWSLAAAALVRSGVPVETPFLEPAGVWLAGRFKGEALEAAVSRLAFARLWPTAESAAHRSEAWRSPLIRVPSRAVLTRALFECADARGRDALRALLAPDPPGTLDSLCALARVPAARVAARYAALSDSLARAGVRAARLSAPRPWRPEDGFQCGVCLAHAVSLENGYLSGACGQELERLRSYGTNWVSITPFGYLSRGHTGIVPSAPGAVDEETDEALCEAAARARALGMRVWLTPHLWARGWVGDLEFDAAGWDRFFAAYREFVLHYALLAQREGMDGLVLGHELVSATRLRGDRWRALIGDVRRIYTGTLTYGANWGEEVERVEFWDALDLVGVSFYPPLAERPTRSVPALRAGAERALASLRAVSEKYGRPVLLLEAGYAAQPDAPVRPWEERFQVSDPETQRACYQALVEALHSQYWIAGVYWWKWFSSGSLGGRAEGSFTPRGKPAEQVLAQAMRSWERRAVRVSAPGPRRSP